jgi:ParB family chromosome partitioning protein
MTHIPKPLSKPAPLGRGLSALFGDADSSYQPRPAVPTGAALPDRTVLTPAITALMPGAFQPRRHFDAESLKELAESIRERGILEPLLVRPVGDKEASYEIVAGERRWRAAQLAGLHNVPVVVRNLTDREALEFALIENVQRQDLSPLEEAEGYQRLIKELNHTQETLARTVGKSRSHIANMLRVLALPDAIKQMVADGRLNFGHARALAVAKDPATLAQEIVKKGLNVRQAEALAQRSQQKPQGRNKKTGAAKTGAASADVAGLERELERLIGLRVKIHTAGPAGSLMVFYQNLDQLDDIIRRLRG